MGQGRGWLGQLWGLLGLGHWLNPYLEYHVQPNRRYQENSPHQRLCEILAKGRASYEKTLGSFLQFRDRLADISRDESTDWKDAWDQPWLVPSDSVALYSLMCLQNPRRYYEVGSGWSTKFARRAVRDYGLQTRIVSIDPKPRAQIDLMCDDVIRKPLEQVGLSTFDDLQANDILFVDGSHRCCMNSDVTAIFLDVLPRLPSGVLVQFHDIFLPYDYPFEWRERWYSEQYLLATLILAKNDSMDVVLPNAYVLQDPVLRGVLDSLWGLLGTRAGSGCSFWLRTP